MELSAVIVALRVIQFSKPLIVQSFPRYCKVLWPLLPIRR